MLVKVADWGETRGMAEQRAETLAERIRAHGAALTRSERLLADAVLHNYPVSGLGSITALAEAAGVSTPTVARMARKLGYGGYPQLQAALRAELEAALSDPVSKQERWAEGAPDGHILNRFAEAAADNLRQSLRRLDSAMFDAVATLLADRARGVHVVGGRITDPLAAYLATHLLRIRPGVRRIDPNPEGWPQHLLDMAAGDVLVIFDIRRYSPEIERLAAMAAAR
ncbi:MAG: RpiR family transcriptional regulator, partial [Alphaproteobacteria bacterium HGW-Alphaproteobacteria-10]